MKLGSEIITVVHAELVTDPFDRSQHRDWEHAESFDVQRCMVQPFLMSNKLIQEDNLQREFTSEYFRIWAPPEAPPIFYFDRIVWRAEQMEIFGQVQPWHLRSGVLHHYQFLGVSRRG